jgi:hypothetical protein
MNFHSGGNIVLNKDSPRRHGAAGFVGMALVLAPLALSAQEGFKGGHQEALGPQFGQNQTPLTARSLLAARTRPSHTEERVHYWNQIAVDCSGLDHTPVAPGETRVFGEQFGPGRASRAMAITHIAMFDALNAIQGRYKSYSRISRAFGRVSADAAIAQAAHDTLVAMYPSQAADLGTLLQDDLNAIRSSDYAKSAGISLGRRAARAILEHSSHDGSQHQEPRVNEEYELSTSPGNWRPDPISQIPLAVGAYWGSMKPFVLDRVTRFRPPPPPSMGSREYTRAFQQVVELGGDASTGHRRTPDQTMIGIYWAYDGTPSLCAPPRLYNQITAHIAREQRTNDPLELLRLLTLTNIAMADAAIVAWEAKYHYEFWRPVTGIREASEGSGPTGRGDGNPNTTGIPQFVPLGSPSTNLHGPNFTPPFPAYPSGHATIGGALFEVLRQFYRTDRIPFTFVSDEFNGVTVDNEGAVRPYAPRSFNKLSEAEYENALSRVYLGVHWMFDAEEGVRAGRKVGRYVFENTLTRARNHGWRDGDQRDDSDEHD